MSTYLPAQLTKMRAALTPNNGRAAVKQVVMATRNNVGLSRLAQAFLAATAIAPVLLVWAAASYEASMTYAASAVIVALLMLGVCVLLLSLAKRELQANSLTITKAVRMDKEALGFLVAYALPLVASKDPTHLIALGVFMLMVGLVLIQLQILHVNPLLGMLGFHFYQVELKNSDTALVITRSRDLPSDASQGQELVPGLWLLI
jgi:hypothetical protein